jgi:chromosome segregation ATPase
MSTDPRIIYAILVELSCEFDHLAHSVRECDAAAHRLKLHLNELLHACGRLARAGADDANRALTSCTSQQARANSAFQRSRNQEAASGKSMTGANAARSAAAAAEQHWKSQVRQARRRVREAEAEVAAAEGRVAAAERRLRAAQRRLSELEDRLSECERPIERQDSNGNVRYTSRDCSHLRHLVADAQADVSHAADALNIEERKLARAEQELQAALADLEHCEACLATAIEALGLAGAAMQRADEAISESTQSVLLTTECVQFATGAVSCADHAVSLCDTALARQSEASRAFGEGLTHLGHLSACSNELNTLCIQGRHVVEDRIDTLIQYNRPSGLGRA